MKLTDEEIKDILVSIDPDTKRLPPGFRDFARAIEAALSAKQGEQEAFIKHEGDDDGWSKWVCPDPKSYLMKCCDCGLVHEAQFNVVRYKSATEREDCDVVDDPNLQAVFRMRRSEQWTPEDTAYRPGGLPLTAPEAKQEPVATLTVRDDMGADIKFHQAITLLPGQTFALYTHPAPSVNAQEESNQCGNGAGCCYRSALFDCKEERISELEAQNERLWVALKGYHSNSAKQDWPDDIWIAAEVALREAAIAAVQSNASTHLLNSANSLE